MTDTVIPDEGSGVPDDAVWIAARAYREFERGRPSHPDAIHAALEAALPALRHHWAEEVATFAEDAADDLELPVMPEWLDQRSWFKDQLHALAARVREYGETKP